MLATPIVVDGLIYAPIGQDPEHGEGIGNLSCVDANGKEVWSYRKINRSLSTLSIQDGLLYVADYSGFVTQESFRLKDFMANRFGRYYDHGGSNEISARLVATGEAGHQRAVGE